MKQYTYKGRVTNVKKYKVLDNAIVQGVSRKNQTRYDLSGRYAGSNGTYVEFGEYLGMRLDITYSLYDTEQKAIELNGKNYTCPKHVTLNIYHEVMELLGKQRMSAELYAQIESYFKGQKRELVIIPDESSLRVNDGWATVDMVYILPYHIQNQTLAVKQNLCLREMA